MHRGILALAVVAIATASLAVEPPGQPSSGPGGQNYPHLFVKETLILNGLHPYRLYEPAWPTPAAAPVLLYLPGVAGPGPYGGLLEFQFFASIYAAMFEHLARKGYTVILPSYGPPGAPLASYEANAIAAAKDALDTLGQPLHVPLESRLFAIGGHSFGGLLALTIANQAQQVGLPQPLALVGHEPSLVSQMQQGCAADPLGPFCQLELPSTFDGVAAGTLNVTIVGGEDRLAVLPATLEQWELPQVSDDLENLLFVHDDLHAGQALVATHLSVGSHPLLDLPGLELDAIDWYGYWKPTEAALDLAFRGESRSFVLGDGELVRFMGLWSDGPAVAPMSVASDFD